MAILPILQQPTYHGGCGTRHAQTRPRLHPWLSAEEEETVELFLTPTQEGELSLQSPHLTPGMCVHPFYCPQGHPTICGLCGPIQDHLPLSLSHEGQEVQGGHYIITLWPRLNKATPYLYDPPTSEALDVLGPT